MSGDVMSFPDNWWTFVQDYQFADKEEVYTNGSMLILSFRVRQMVEHYFGGEVGKTSRYSELFGTPERAAQLIADNCEFLSYCGQCWIRAANCDGKYSTVLEWLRGESDGE